MLFSFKNGRKIIVIKSNVLKKGSFIVSSTKEKYAPEGFWKYSIITLFNFLTLNI